MCLFFLLECDLGWNPGFVKNKKNKKCGDLTFDLNGDGFCLLKFK